MNKYAFLDEYFEKDNLVFYSDSIVNTMNKRSAILNLLKTNYLDNTVFIKEGNYYPLVNSYILCVSIDDIDINAVFNSIPSNLDDIKKEVYSLKNADNKILSVIELLDSFNPLFFYSLSHISCLKEIKINTLFIHKEDIKTSLLVSENNNEVAVKKEKIEKPISVKKPIIKKPAFIKKIQKSINGYITSLDILAFISSFILTFFSGLFSYLVSENNYLYILALIFMLFSIALFIDISVEHKKKNSTDSIFLRGHVDTIFFSSIALLLALTTFILISKYAIKIEANNSIFLFTGLGALISTVCMGIITLIAVAPKLINRFKNKKIDNK